MGKLGHEAQVGMALGVAALAAHTWQHGLLPTLLHISLWLKGMAQ